METTYNRIRELVASGKDDEAIRLIDELPESERESITRLVVLGNLELTFGRLIDGDITWEQAVEMLKIPNACDS